MTSPRGSTPPPEAGRRSGRGRVGLALALPVALAACDASTPPYAPRLVVEAFIETGDVAPVVTLRRSLPSTGPPGGDVADAATVQVVVDGLSVPVAGTGEGRYRVGLPRALAAGQRLSLVARWGEAPSVEALTEAVEAFRFDSVRVERPARPVRAALLNDFGFDPDLVSDLVRREGHVYPVTVTAVWTAPPLPAGRAPTWVRLQLAPEAPAAVRFFFPPEALAREATAGDPGGLRRVRVTYAVEAAGADAEIAPHRLRVAGVRGGDAYARFVATREAPDRREPSSNVRGGRGLFAAVSTDSLRLDVR